MLTAHDISNQLNLGTTKSREVLLQAVDLFHNNAFSQSVTTRRAGFAERNIVVFGSGHFSLTFIQARQRKGLNPIAVVDDFRLGLECSGVKIISSRAFSSLTRAHPNLLAVSGARYDNAVRHFNRLSSETGVPVVSFEQGVRMYGVSEDIDYRLADWGPMIAKRIKDYLGIENRMADEYSRETLYAVLLFHLTGSMEWIHRIYRPYQTLYFRSGLFSLHENERFIDCGASIGESTSGLLALTHGKFEKIWMIDPDHHNQATLRGIIEKQPPSVASRISLHSVALGSGPGRMPFNHVGGHGGSIACETHTYGEMLDVDIQSIDDMIDTPPTLIKMDIEGAELNALQGARQAIIRGKPVMTVSAYHRATDLIDLPDYVESISEDYRIGLRHHTEERWDTCLYFLPPDR